MSDRKTVSKYQLLDHGVEGSQYFQGCGTIFTEYDQCATGCGENFQEALEDALESIGQDGYDADALEARIREDEGHVGRDWPTTPSASSVFQKHNPDAYDAESEEWDMDGCELYYYVSICYSGAGE